MKKLVLLLACTMLLPMASQAKKKKTVVKTFSDTYIYAQSGRNSEKKGSAISLTTGLTYSLENAMNMAGTSDIDMMLYHGKANGLKQKVFHLFAPENPGAVIDWEKDGGTSPYCKFEGKSDNPDSYFALKNWKKRNATKMERVVIDNFNDLTYEDLDSLKVADNYIVTDIKLGDMIAFELGAPNRKAGKKGVLIVKGIEDDETKPEKAGQGQYQKLLMIVKIQK